MFLPVYVPSERVTARVLAGLKGSAKSRTAQQLAATSGYTARTVRRALAVLVARGVVRAAPQLLDVLTIRVRGRWVTARIAPRFRLARVA